MKLSIFSKLQVFLLLFSCWMAYSEQISGPMTQEIYDEFGNVERFTIYYVSESKNYTSGGVSFTYPSELFSETPVVRVAVESLDPLSTNQTLTAYISANSTTGATVEVNFINTVIAVPVISEATSGTVKVHIFAIAP